MFSNAPQELWNPLSKIVFSKCNFIWNKGPKCKHLKWPLSSKVTNENCKYEVTSMRIYNIKIRWSHNRRISLMEIPIPGKTIFILQHGSVNILPSFPVWNIVDYCMHPHILIHKEIILLVPTNKPWQWMDIQSGYWLGELWVRNTDGRVLFHMYHTDVNICQADQVNTTPNGGPCNACASYTCWLILDIVKKNPIFPLKCEHFQIMSGNLTKCPPPELSLI